MLRQNTASQKNLHLLLPVAGILLFVLLYLIAADMYPGGSQVDKNSPGFSWINNYWCNLLNEVAINGRRNPAKPVAMAGMVVLGLSLSYFWWLFPKHLAAGRRAKPVIRISGVAAMTSALFLFSSDHHDLVTNLAAMFGLVALTGTLYGLYNNQWYGLLALGFLNILLVGVNNYVYYTKGFIFYLPVIQKISFAFFLLFIGAISVNLYKNQF